VIEKLKRPSAGPAPIAIQPPKASRAAPRQAAYYAPRFGVKLNPDTQSSPLGLQEASPIVRRRLRRPATSFLFPIELPITRTGSDGRRCDSLLPSDPTPCSSRRWSAPAAFDSKALRSLCATREKTKPDCSGRGSRLYRDIIALRKARFDLLSDLAYAEVYSTRSAPSILQVPAPWSAVEFTSCEDQFDPGWRIGFAVAMSASSRRWRRVKILSRLRRFHADSGCRDRGLNGPMTAFRMRDTYRRRRDVLVESFGRAGWTIPPPRASDVCVGALPSHSAPSTPSNFPLC